MSQWTRRLIKGRQPLHCLSSRRAVASLPDELPFRSCALAARAFLSLHQQKEVSLGQTIQQKKALRKKFIRGC